MPTTRDDTEWIKALIMCFIMAIASLGLTLICGAANWWTGFGVSLVSIGVWVVMFFAVWLILEIRRRND